MGLESIFNLSITNTSVSVSQQGFGIPLILGYHTRFAERARTYSTLAAMVADGFVTTDMEYRAAAAVFAQNPRPPSIIVGRRLTRSTHTVEVTPTAVNSAVYTLTIDGTEYAYTADASATVAEITAGLVALINADGAALVTAADNTTKLTLTGDSFHQFTLEMSATNNAELRAQDITTDAGVATDLADLLAASKDWYALILTSKGAAETVAAAAWVESNKRLFFASTMDYDCTTSSTTDLASDLETAAYGRTALKWHHAPWSFPEAAWFGKVSPYAVGAADYAYKTLSGIEASPTTPGNLTDTAITNLEAKRCNYYLEINGVNVTLPGKVSANEWIDVVVGMDWTAARMREGIYAARVANSKIPYTDQGIAVILAVILGVLKEGARNGLFVKGSESASFPALSDISSTDKSNRHLPDGTFSAQLQGAINTATIAGTVSVD